MLVPAIFATLHFSACWAVLELPLPTYIENFACVGCERLYSMPVDHILAKYVIIIGGSTVVTEKIMFYELKQTFPAFDNIKSVSVASDTQLRCLLGNLGTQ